MNAEGRQLACSRMLRDLSSWLERARDRLGQGDGKAVPVLLLAALGFGAAGVVLAVVAGGYHGGFHALHTLLQASLSDGAWIGITRFGDASLLAVISLLVAVRRPDVFWALIIATLACTLYARGLKLTVEVLRPSDILPADVIRVIGPRLHGHSFPSGHSASAFVFAGVLFAFSVSWTQRLLLLLLAALVGLSRVALGVHWPVDVLAGAAGGLLSAAAGVWLAGRGHAGLSAPVFLFLQVVPLSGLITLILGSKGNPPAPVLVGATVSIVLLLVLVRVRNALQDGRDT